MAKFDGFIGGSYESRSLALDAQRSLNLYLETDESGAGKNGQCLMGTPGLSDWLLLPTAPIRGIWTGLADTLPGSNLPDQMNVVAGSKLYAITYTGGTPAYSLIGDVGTDAANSPVTFQVNGSQLFISSAGQAWVYDYSGLSRVYYNDGFGTVNTAGTAVTWVTGSPFDASQVGGGININGTVYLITAVDPSGASCTLASSAGTQTGVSFYVLAGASQVNTSSSLGTYVVTWMSGSLFTGLASGNQVVIDGAVYTIASIQSSTQFTLTASPGLLYNVALSFSQAVIAGQTAFLDTYFVALPPNSKSVNISQVADGRTWSPLDYANKESFPDDVNAILADHEQLWLFGTEETEVWVDTGAAGFPFQRSQVVSTGIRAPFSAVSIGNGVAWIGGDQRGNPIAYYTEGYIPGRVSTHAIEEQWGTYSTITDAIAYVESRDGHLFWVIHFPTGNATWVYDLVEKQWHERGWFNGTTPDNRHRAAFHGYVWGMHIGGDWQTGQLYQVSSTAYNDAGTAIYRIRTAPHLSNEENWTFHHRFRLAMQAGPSPTLTWSDDLGQSYITAKAASARSFAGAQQNSEWRRNGKTRSRIYQVTITDAVQICLVAAYLDLEQGGG